VRLRGSDGGLFKIGTFFGVRTLGGLCRHLQAWASTLRDLAQQQRRCDALPTARAVAGRGPPEAKFTRRHKIRKWNLSLDLLLLIMT